MRRRIPAFGLRPRLLAALVFTSAITLAVAALALLSPLRDDLRQRSARDLEAAMLASRAQFERVLRAELKQTRGQTADQRHTSLLFAVQDPALKLRQRTDSRVVVFDPLPAILYDTDIDLTPPLREALRTLREEQTVRAISGDEATVAMRLFVERGRAPYVLTAEKRLTDVTEAVDQVRNAFLAAAGAGLLVALVLGVALATTLGRRLARLRAAAVRISREGIDAPPPPPDAARDEVGDLSRALRRMQAELRRQEAARRAFVATASHELRTPLTSLQGTLELLEEDLRDGRLDEADAQRQLAGARGELRRLARLAAELLDLSRLDAQVPLRSEPVELGELCRAVVAEFGLNAWERGVSLDPLPPPGPVWAGGDPTAMARVVRILIDNALRYSPQAGSVSIAAAYHGQSATVEVRDEGPGVPEAERELIFERFQRGRDRSGEGGFGLGLAIGRELAARMGGTLDLLAPGEAPGARFRLTLPIELPAGSHGAGESEPAPPRVPAASPGATGARPR